MTNSRLMNVLQGPVVSEKANAVQANNTIVFKVLKDASKPEIKTAVERIFGVEVDAVRTLNVKGKARRSIHGMGRRSDWKKAYVTLKQGQSFDFTVADAQKESN